MLEIEERIFDIEHFNNKKFLFLQKLENVDKDNILNLYESLIGDSHICCLIDKNCINVEQKPLGTKGKIGIPYLLYYKRQKLYVSKFSPFQPEIHYKTNPPVSIRKIREGGNIQCLSREIEDLHYLGLDEFTNELCIGYIIEKVFRINADMIQNNAYFGVKYIYGATCGRKGIHVMEYGNLGDLSKFVDKRNDKTDEYTYIHKINDNKFSKNKYLLKLPLEEHLETILSQVTSALHYLNETIEFTSGDLKPENIFLTSNQVYGNYAFLNISGPFTCKIADYGKSSCTFTTNEGERLRIYNWNKLASYYLKFKDFNPEIRKENRKSYYIVDDFFLSQTYTYLRHMGIPYYRSFDYYTFIISLLIIPEFFYAFFRSPYLIERFWNKVWINQKENKKMTVKLFDAMINNKKGRVSYEDALKLLKGRKLMCSAITRVVYNL